ncbi:G protein gamma subunit [Phycomyces blakesleeanus]
MLEFQKEILTEIVADDALTILAPGLGLFRIMCSLIEMHCRGNHLVFLLNSNPEQNAALREHLMMAGILPDKNLKVIDSDTPAETRVRSDAMEELILNVYRKENEASFIKAFSDNPSPFVSGFAPLQTILKSLRLRKVQLWPRFQVLVADNLSATEVDVIELRQPMSPSMEIIQKGLIECLEATLAELRRQNPTLDTQEVTIENSFFKMFDVSIRRRLSHIWHKVSPSSKQLIDDLGNLRRLLVYLTEYDAVSFYSILETIVDCGTPSKDNQQQFSKWLLLGSANTVIMEARKRVYLKPDDPEYNTTETWHGYTPINMPPSLRLTLEDQPKWELLRDILEEIEQDMDEATQGKGAPVLVMVKSLKTCAQLRRRLVEMSDPDYEDDKKPTMMTHLVQNLFSVRGNRIKILNPTATAATPTASPASPAPPPPFLRSSPFNKRRRTRGGSTTAGTGGTRSESTNDTQDSVQSSSQTTQECEAYQPEIKIDMAQVLMPTTTETISSEFIEIPKENTITIHCYEPNLNDQILEDTEPLFVIMYDPDPAFVRSIEIYRSLNPHLNVRVYFMVYENSVEEQVYLSEIRKEKEAFERMIREKSASRNSNDGFVSAVNSRILGGHLKPSEPAKIIVDMREFRNPLPPILYSQGIDIVPYTQCEAMSEHYKIPILLIEFDDTKAAPFQSLSEVKEHIVGTDITSKLVLLTITFPKLKIIWSPSQHETSLIFADLKKSQEQPDADIAASIGTNGARDEDRMYNITPEEMLRSMPGITSANYSIIMNAVNNLEDLCKVKEPELQKLIGKEPAKKFVVYGIYEYNEKLREQLEIQRIPVSEASRSLIEYCQNNSDYMVPSVLNTKRPDPYAETTGDCGCVLM